MAQQTAVGPKCPLVMSLPLPCYPASREQKTLLADSKEALATGALAIYRDNQAQQQEQRHLAVA